jgi:hypothetical protein
MIRKLGLALIVCALVAVVVWLPREDEIGAEVQPIAGEPLVVGLRAVKGVAVPPFAERWALTYPEFGPTTQTFNLEIGPLAGRSATGRLTASSSGDTTPFFDRLVLVFGADGEPEPLAGGAAPAPVAYDLQLDLIGDDLTYGPSDVGSTVLAGAFIASPPGEWRAYRVTIGGATGPQYFLGVSERARAARLIPCVIEDAPAIVAAFRRLLQSAPKPRES